MVLTISLKRGLDVPVSGTPEQRIDEGRDVSTVALLGRDYPGLKPKLLVEPGQAVRQGEALFSDPGRKQAPIRLLLLQHHCGLTVLS